MKKFKLTTDQHNWLMLTIQKFDVVSVTLHGSHLYGLDREGSDVDLKVIYMPKFEDLVVGKSPKTYKYENEELNIEIEVKSIHEFLRSSKAADTNCLDLLHAPDWAVILSTPVWENIKRHRSDLYAKNMKGVVGYIKTHAKKYSSKIDRLSELNWLLGLCNDIKINYPDNKVIDVAESSELVDELVDGNLKYIKPVKSVVEGEQMYLEVCGKKYIYTWSINQLIEALNRDISQFGNRTNKGLGSGVDGKSLSHALRVLVQLREILVDRTITFPLKEHRDYIKQIKTGQETNLQKILDDLDKLYDECMILLETSDLQEQPFIDLMQSEVVGYYKEDL